MPLPLWPRCHWPARVLARGPRAPGRKRPPCPPALRLFVERLEDRTLPAGQTLATASPVTFGPEQAAALSGDVSFRGDVHLYALQLAAGDTVTAAVAAQSQ